MRALDAMPEVEKTSLFGTAVHAVLAAAGEIAPTHRSDALAGARASPVDAIAPVAPSLEDVFLDVVEQAAAALMRKALAVGRKELRQIRRDRRTLLILLFVPAFFLLLYGYALNFDIRHVAARRRGPRPHAREPRARLGVRELRLLRSGRRRSTSRARGRRA